MSRKLKFRIVYQHDETRRILEQIIELGQVFSNLGFLDPRWYIIRKEQYTGFKDATIWEDLTEGERSAWTRGGKMPSEWTGKEIYEGDIIRYEFDEKESFLSGNRVKDPGYTVSKVVFFDGCFMHVIIEQKNAYFGDLPSEPRKLTERSTHEYYCVQSCAD